MSIRDRLRALGIGEARLASLGHGTPTAPAVDDALVAELMESSGQTREQVSATLEKNAAEMTLAARPQLVRSASARSPIPPPRRDPFADARRRLRGIPDPNDGGGEAA